MKKILLSITLLVTLSGLKAQSVVDSVSSGAGYQLDVFYNLTTGSADTVRNNNWHLAFATRKAQPPFDVMRSVTIRSNESRGVSVYQSTQTDWSTFDSTGFPTWPLLHDNDSSWDVGGLNQGYNIQQFNFGWGSYDMATSNVNGSTLYLIKITSGSSSTYKKFKIEKLSFDTSWIFTSSNLDGTDSVTSVINKADYTNKLFAYHNILTHTTLDREPNHPWDLLFTYYRTKASIGGYPETYYNFAGILQAPQLNTARVVDVPTLTSDTSDATLYSKKIGTIGWDWKLVVAGPPSNPYDLIDSLSYFIKRDADSLIYKFVVTKFTYDDGTLKQEYVFNKTKYSILTTGIADINTTSSNSFVVYPNPASSFVVINNLNAKKTIATIYDITGKAVSTSTAINASEIKMDLNNFNSGIYFITVDLDGVKQTKKLIVE